MDEFERRVLDKFPDFPSNYREATANPELAQLWFTAYQTLIEYLDGRHDEDDEDDEEAA